ncbi:MAG: hypothetical protein QM533_03020 [Cytophagales bacterium]|nr:hypothetical protein [Cytophagales bacterium]
MKTAITQHTNIMGNLLSIETSVQQLTIWESDYESMVSGLCWL